MNENIGSKGKGNDYRRVLMNLERKKKKLAQQSQIKKEKNKQVVLVSDSPSILFSDPTKKQGSNDSLFGKECEKINEEQSKKKEESHRTLEQEKKQSSKQRIVGDAKVEEQKPKVVKKDTKSVDSQEKTPTPIVIPDELDKKNERSTVPRTKESESILPKKPKEKPALTDREKIENEALVQVLNEKIYDIEYELRNLAYREWVIRKQVDEVQESKEAQRLVDELEQILIELQKLLEDLDENDYLFDQTYLEELGIQLEHKISNREYVGDNRFILYFDQLIARIEKAQDEVESLKKETEEKGEELGFVEEDYDKHLEEYYEQEKIADMVQEMVERQEAIVRDIDEKLANAVTTSERTRYVMDGISRQTKNLMAGLAVGMLVPGIRGISAVALGVTATITGIRHFVNPPYHTEVERTVTVDNYQKIIHKGTLDVSMARALLNDNMKYLEDIMKQCEAEFSTYPAYSSIAADFEKLQVVLMEQDAYFAKIEDNLYKQKNLNQEQLKLVRE